MQIRAKNLDFYELLAGPGLLGAVGPGPGAEQVLKEAQLMVEVKLWVDRLAKPHAVALADLVLFAGQGGESGAVPVLGEAHHVVGVEDEITGLGHGALAGAHAADGERGGDEVVMERDRVLRRAAEEVDDHLASDAKLGLLRAADDAGEAQRYPIWPDTGEGSRASWWREMMASTKRLTLEHGVGGAEQGEVPEHSLERGGVHWEDAVEALANRP